VVSPYATAVALNRPAPKYISTKQEDDLQRVQAYWTYDDIYNNVAEAFEALLRSDEDPKGRRYVPYGRAILEGTNRYLGRDLTVTYEVPVDSPADEVAQADLANWVKALFDREGFVVRFAETKRTMLRRGDAFLQISADTSKPEGSRLRITALDGAQYFPIFMGTDRERVAGVYIITLLTSPDKQTVVAQREWYQRILTPEDVAAVPGSVLGGIYYKIDFFEQDKWDDRFPLSKNDLSPTGPPNWINWGAYYTGGDGNPGAFAGFMLPATVTAIPVYHFKNTDTGPFGFSLLQGLESVLAGITQGVSDEDMAIALAGIGVYATDSGTPRNAKGEEVDWIIAPGSVLELETGRNFKRVEGVSSVQPIQDHVETLKDVALESSGTPDIAVGKVDVNVAESGVALAIKMAPVIAANKEREDGMAAVLTQFLFDLLNGWAPAYEGRQPIEGTFTVNVTFGDPMPVDRAAVIAEIVELIAAKIIDTQYAQQYLADKLGFNFPTDLLGRMQAADAAALDAQAGRLALEAGPADPGAVSA
jgi:hypothetical protein